MTLNVEWSLEANQAFLQTVEQIREKWTEKEVENFITRTQQVIEHIGQNPAMYPFSKKGLVHRAVISKQTSLFYHIRVDKIVLLSFEDNRQNPKRTKY